MVSSYRFPNPLCRRWSGRFHWWVRRRSWGYFILQQEWDMGLTFRLFVADKFLFLARLDKVMERPIGRDERNSIVSSGPYTRRIVCLRIYTNLSMHIVVEICWNGGGQVHGTEPFVKRCGSLVFYIFRNYFEAVGNRFKVLEGVEVWLFCRWYPFCVIL